MKNELETSEFQELITTLDDKIQKQKDTIQDIDECVNRIRERQEDARKERPEQGDGYIAQIYGKIYDLDDNTTILEQILNHLRQIT